MNPNVLMAVAATAELTGAELSKAALAIMVSDLADYPEAHVLAALTRCRKELKTRLTLGAVLERIHATDGRLNGDEAWALAIRAVDESDTVIWTDEICGAWSIARPIYDARDRVGARVAFRDAYERLCSEARADNRPVRWAVSQGWDVEKRRVAVQGAVLAGYLTHDVATALLPAPEDEGVVGRLLLGKPVDGEHVPADVRLRCASLLENLKGRAAA
jgi:hypothetical protein